MEPQTCGRGQWERRELITSAAVQEDWPPWRGGQQVFRVTHRTKETEQGKVTIEALYR